MDGPLSGLRVIDSTTVLAMPTAMYLMGDMGAEVVKVETHTRGRGGGGGVTYADNIPPKDSHWNRDGSFHALHRSKLGITLNYKVPETVEAFKDLVRVSDVLAENNRPGTMDRLGLGYEELKKIKPDLIYFSFSGFGYSGPWKNYQGIGRMFELTSGVSQFTGYPDEGPRRVGSAWFDPPNGWMAVFAILAAIHHRNQTGEGQWIDHSMYQMGVSTVGDALLDYIANGRNGNLMGNRHTSKAPHGAYKCSGDDNWIAISVESDNQWDALKKVMGDPEWASEDKFGDVITRWHNQDELDSHINKWTKDFEHLNLMEKLIEAGVPSGAILNPKEVLNDPSMKGSSIFEKLEFPAETGMGTRVFLGRPWSMSDTPSHIRRPGPDLGGDNEYVLGNLLGRTETQINELYELGGIGKKPEPMDKPGTIQDFAREVEQGTLRSYDTEYKKLLGIGP
tara:strand:- start:1692 stop:3041 length:1350 start_codon:yes stop_codon:yes gene_type:complete